MGVMIENFAGNFPAWLAPVQVAVIPVRENHESIAQELTQKLKDVSIRANFMEAAENMGKRVRKAKDIRTPYTIIIGDKDIEANMVTVEKRGQETGSQMKFEDFLEMISKEIKTRSL